MLFGIVFIALMAVACTAAPTTTTGPKLMTMILVESYQTYPPYPISGGYSDETPASADPEIQKIADAVKNKAVQQLGVGQSVSQWEAISYRSQVVNGYNYRLKIQTGPNQYVHVDVYTSFDKSHPAELSEVKANKSLKDAL